MTVRKRLTKYILCLALVLLIGGQLILSAFSVTASAAETSYSNVLDDLSKDSSFNPDEYPSVPTDYSLKVIQVAEGKNGELFLYVYQPSNDTKDLRATYINMSLQEPANKDVTYSLYSLTWLNSNGVFAKYKVDGITVSDEECRYYTIAAIYRAFNESLGDISEAGKDDLINYKAFSVSKSWCFSYYNNILLCESKSIMSVKATIHSVGYTRYWDGFSLLDGVEYCDAHFVAFSIDNFENVQWVYDADLSFFIRPYEFYGSGGYYSNYSYTAEAEKRELTISDTQEGSNDPDIPFFSKKYTWDRIVTTDTFIQETEDQTNKFISDEAKANLKSSKFVFRFLETERFEEKSFSINGYDTYTGTAVSEVALLRLHFLADNKVYNLGVVSDIVSDDGTPDFVVDALDNVQNNLEESLGALKIIMGLVLLILALVFFAGPIVFILKILWTGLELVFSIIWGIISLPFKVITWLFNSK